jgi:hypothetical protein
MTMVAARPGVSLDRFREAGYWLDKSVDQLLTEAVAKAPDKVAVVDDRADRERAPRWFPPRQNARRDEAQGLCVAAIRLIRRDDHFAVAFAAVEPARSRPGRISSSWTILIKGDEAGPSSSALATTRSGGR